MDIAKMPLDSDDDSDSENSMDLLKIISQGQNKAKIVQIEKPEKSLITAEDLKEIESFKVELGPTSVKLDKNTLLDGKKEQIKGLINENINLDASSGASSSLSNNSEMDNHTIYLCNKELIKNNREKFRPYQTTITKVHEPKNEVLKQHRVRENSAATPPILRHPGVKSMTLQESIELQLENERHNKVSLFVFTK